MVLGADFCGSSTVDATSTVPRTSSALSGFTKAMIYKENNLATQFLYIFRRVQLTYTFSFYVSVKIVTSRAVWRDKNSLFFISLRFLRLRNLKRKS